MADRQENHPDLSELEFLCHTIRENSEQGVDNMVERCLIQFTVDIVTEGYSLEVLNEGLERKEGKEW